jgi:hypothetical protein
MLGSFVYRIAPFNIASRRSMLALLSIGLLLAFAVAAAPIPAGALTIEQARENCRSSVGRPIVQACMQSLRGSGGDREANLAKCRAGATGRVHACVQAALNAANGRADVPLALKKDDKSKADFVAPGNALPAGFVAPPRTIADIAAILDSEKPDPATLAKLKSDADGEPAKGWSTSALSEFYYNRGQARALLGRAADALADGERAANAARSSGDFYFTQRIQIFNRDQLRSLGDMKAALP